MSDAKMVSERDAVLRERAAYVRGLSEGSGWNPVLPQVRAAALYPLATMTRPRVVRSGNVWFKVGKQDALLINEQCHAGCDFPHAMSWEPISKIPVEHVAAVADLLARPTEEVSDE